MYWKRLVVAVLLVGAGLTLGVLIAPRESGSDRAMSVSAPVRCVEHGVPEDVCTRCHPELIPVFEASGDWCAGHGVPESQCSLCNPSLTELGVLPPTAQVDRPASHDQGSGESHGNASGASASSGDSWDAHTPRSGMSIIYRTNQPLCPTDQAVIQFASVETAARAGLEVGPVITGHSAERFEAPAEVVFDRNAATTVTSTLPVTVVKWLREPGTRVHAGDMIATVESPEMAQLQGEYLAAHADRDIHEREKERATELISRSLIDSAGYERSVAEAIAAEAKLIQWRSRLRLAGMAEGDLSELLDHNRIVTSFGLRATTDGVLLERVAPLGIVLEPGSALARVGDPTALWIEARVRESDLDRVALGQTVEFTADGDALRRVSGTIIWVSQFLDPHSRTATVRVKPDASGDGLRAHGFGRVNIIDESAEAAILVPKDAVQWEGCCNVVFVREAPDRFRPNKVAVGRADAGYYRIVSGLRPSDEVVVGGSFLLKTELKKGSIGAGCCGLEASS